MYLETQSTAFNNCFFACKYLISWVNTAQIFNHCLICVFSRLSLSLSHVVVFLSQGTPSLSRSVTVKQCLTEHHTVSCIQTSMLKRGVLERAKTGYWWMERREEKSAGRTQEVYCIDWGHDSSHTEAGLPEMKGPNIRRKMDAWIKSKVAQLHTELVIKEKK